MGRKNKKYSEKQGIRKDREEEQKTVIKLDGKE